MANIRILPEQLANRIAAGEVVERPASVVKELVENSLDAGADRIEVEVEGGGTRLIRVIDNGAGMDGDDVLLCFERHGTSKILEPHDLAAINTLGFRGEAIPSIASVSHMTVTSRTAESELGTTVVFDYGYLQKTHETGCRQGTLIEVRNLFKKTPARKKFLRTQRTELGHIDEIIKNYALASPATAFSLRVNGRESISLGKDQELEERLRAIINYHDKFIPVQGSTSQPDKRRLHGFLLPPERSSGAAARIRLFINGRAIRDRLMSHAVFEGLRGFLLKGHSPGGYLHLHLPAEELDVNVHPAKHEVRFRNSGDIHQFIKQSVETAMREHQQSLQTSYFTPRDPGSPSSEDALATLPDDSFPSTPSPVSEEPRERISNPGSISSTASKQREVPISPETTPPLRAQQPEIPPPISAEPMDPSPYLPGGDSKGQLEEREENYSTYYSDTGQDTHKGIRHRLQIIGQFKNLYIFCRSGDNLLVIDQHAAHERLLYEQFRRQYSDGKVASQRLLFPETVELTPFQIELVETNSDELARMGFDISDFGGNSYIISAVPALAGQGGAADIFFEVLDGFGRENQKSSSGGRLETILATMACKAAVKSGDELSTREIDALLEKMAEADLFSHCPHGRPVLRSFTESEIKKWFYRT